VMGPKGKPGLRDVMLAVSGPSEDETLTDETLTDSLKTLFPEVDPKDALRCLTYVMRHCSPED